MLIRDNDDIRFTADIKRTRHEDLLLEFYEG
jgi:hypothetical protein